MPDKQKNIAQFSIEELRTLVGTKVFSSKTNNTGTLISVSDYIDREDYVYSIDWDDGNKTINVWHFWGTNIFFI